MKRFLQVLALIFFGFIGLIGAFFLLMLLLEFFANLVLSHRVGINGALGWMIAGIICLAIGGGGVWFALSMDRCPACKKIFAMKPGKREFLGKENVVERKEYNIYNRNHEVTGTYEKDVPVTKLYYYQWYMCKYCGHKESETIVR